MRESYTIDVIQQSVPEVRTVCATGKIVYREAILLRLWILGSDSKKWNKSGWYEKWKWSIRASQSDSRMKGVRRLYIYLGRLLKSYIAVIQRRTTLFWRFWTGNRALREVSILYKPKFLSKPVLPILSISSQKTARSSPCSINMILTGNKDITTSCRTLGWFLFQCHKEMEILFSHFSWT